MGKEADKFVKDFKATKARLKELTPQVAEKKKKAVIAQLDKTWAEEDKMKAGVVKAAGEGVEGTKPDAFVKHGAVSKPHKAWKAALSLHHKGIEEFDKFRAEARALEQSLSKRIKLVEKELKKGGGGGQVDAVLKEAKSALPQLKKAADVFGTMQGHVVMYGGNEARATEAIVKQAIDSTKPKKLPPALAKENRAKTENTVKGFEKKIMGIVKLGSKLAESGDLAKSEKVVEKVQPLLKKLAALDKEVQVAAKKMKKEIKAAKDSKEVEALIKRISDVNEACIEAVEDLSDQIEQGREDQDNNTG